MLKFTQGDALTIQLTAKSNGLPVNLTGASFVTKIRGPNGAVIAFPNGQHTVAPNQTTTGKGHYSLALSAGDTESLALGEHREIITVITIGSSIMSYHGPDVLTVLANAPVQ